MKFRIFVLAGLAEFLPILVFSGCSSNHGTKVAPSTAAHIAASQPAPNRARPPQPDLAGHTPTEQLNSGRVGLTAADVAFYLKVVSRAVRDAQAAPAQLSPKPAIAKVKALSRQEVAALKAHDMARFQQFEQQAAAATRALQAKVHAAAFSVRESGKLGMPEDQWAALSSAVGEEAQNLRTWQRGIPLARITGTKIPPFCPAHQRPGLSAHYRYSAKDFAILHTACLTSEAAVLPHLPEIVRLNSAYIAEMKQRGAFSFHIVPIF